MVHLGGVLGDVLAVRCQLVGASAVVLPDIDLLVDLLVGLEALDNSPVGKVVALHHVQRDDNRRFLRRQHLPHS